MPRSSYGATWDVGDTGPPELNLLRDHSAHGRPRRDRGASVSEQRSRLAAAPLTAGAEGLEEHDERRDGYSHPEKARLHVDLLVSREPLSGARHVPIGRPSANLTPSPAEISYAYDAFYTFSRFLAARGSIAGRAMPIPPCLFGEAATLR